MEHLIDPQTFVGETVNVEAREGDMFTNDFQGHCIGVRNGFLQVRDADDDVWEVETSQCTVVL